MIETSSLWYAVRVRSNFEKTTAAYLGGNDLDVFVPTYRDRRRWADRIKTVDAPLFPGYVFCRFDAAAPLPVLQAPGVVHIVSTGTRPSPVAEEELEAVRRLAAFYDGPRPCPFLNAGDRVRIEWGPLAGLEGILLQVKDSCRIVVSVSLLGRSVATEIDPAWVKPLRRAAAAASGIGARL